MSEKSLDLERPTSRRGIVARDLANGMVYIRHPRFSSRIINRESWHFLQLCDGRDLDQLSQAVTKLLGFSLPLDQLKSSISQFADRGFFEGSEDTGRNYRICDASPLLSKFSRLMPLIANRYFGGVTLIALIGCFILLGIDWTHFTGSVAAASRSHPVATIFLYYITFIPIALLHELGHASAANYYGAEVPEIVICSNGNFAVVTNTSVLRNRSARIWYLSMGTVVDVYIWLALLIAFHYSNNYVLLLFLLPQTIYFLIFIYSIFKNSDYLKVVCEIFGQPVPAKPWTFLRNSWAHPPKEKAKRWLLLTMTISLAVKLAVTAFLIWTFLKIEPRVLVLYLFYRFFVYVIGRWPRWLRRWTRGLRTPILQTR